MKVIYRAKLKEPFYLEDYWPTPFMNGEFKPVVEGEKATAFEVSFSNQPTDLSPKVDNLDGKMNITIRDTLLPFVRIQLDNSLSYIQCYFDVEISINEIKSFYIGENPEEESQIEIKEWSTGKAENLPTVPYDLFTRAIMASDKGPSPSFEATLLNAGRKSMLEKKYIDSFRYSFLLIDAIYSRGKFKSAQIKEALKGSDELKKIIRATLEDPIKLKQPSNSDTAKLLAENPNVDEVIDHLVDKRGYYFHGNVNRKDGWRPQDQKSAEVLSLLAIGIAFGISHQAAAPMFEEEFNIRHFENARKVGAIMTLQVKFDYHNNPDKIHREGTINLSMPGTKATSKMAMYAMQQFLEKFENGDPTAILNSASCSLKGTDQKVFEITFHNPQPPSEEE